MTAQLPLYYFTMTLPRVRAGSSPMAGYLFDVRCTADESAPVASRLTRRAALGMAIKLNRQHRRDAAARKG